MMTTLDLAQLVAQAAIRATQHQGPEPYKDNPAFAVLEALRTSGHWFCALVQDADGIIDSDYAPRQLDLLDPRELGSEAHG